MKEPRLLLSMYNSSVNDSVLKIWGVSAQWLCCNTVEILIHFSISVAVTSSIEENLSLSMTIFGACLYIFVVLIDGSFSTGRSLEKGRCRRISCLFCIFAKPL